MKNNKKGFTLIELLAVIVILAIIALIATPIVLNMIKNARISAAKSSTLGYIDSVNSFIPLAEAAKDLELKDEDYKNAVIPTGECVKTDNVWGSTECQTFYNLVDKKTKGSKPTDIKIAIKNHQVKEGAEFTTNKFHCSYLNNDVTCGNEEVSSNTPSTPEVTYKCKRATKLHTETCSQTSNYCFADGYSENGSKGTTTITYGNETTTKGELNTGDAFDCDVNGDGEYKEETERFYYVTDMNNDTAVLVYYNNVSEGEPSNSTAYAYVSKDDYIAAGGSESDYGSYGNWDRGPLTAIKQLPKREQWSNVSLSSTTRNIKDNAGTQKVNGFNYAGYAARLLTTQEIESGCGLTVGSFTKGEVSTKCQFLMENTKYSSDSSSSLKTYGPWLETPDSSFALFAWYVNGLDRIVSSNSVDSASGFGVRPAIEVLKSDISL